jgi:hypothetical protein
LRRPRRAALIMAAAQPTPLSTVIAPVGQLSWQAPHSMHASGRTRSATAPSGAKTPCGQTMLHMPQLMHKPGSYSRVLILSFSEAREPAPRSSSQVQAARLFGSIIPSSLSVSSDTFC